MIKNSDFLCKKLIDRKKMISGMSLFFAACVIQPIQQKSEAAIIGLPDLSSCKSFEADTSNRWLEFRFWPKPGLATGEYSTAKLTFGAVP